jgi:peptidoglycan/xylan/chitin deacetylase (PgdA/CDA1 family)
MSFRGEPRDRVTQRRSGESGVTAGRVAAVGSLIVVATVVAVIVLDAGSRPAASSSTSQSASASGAIVQPGTASVPILVYHVINTQPAQSTADPALYVPVGEFSSQMQALKADGWHAVTLDQLEAYWTRGTSLGSGKPIVITFDNGYASQYSNALPILMGLGWVGVENLQVTGLPPSDGGLTDVQIRGLLAAGWELDTQGLSHLDLASLDPAQLSDEVASARQTLRSRYGAAVNWFSYPSGDYDPAVIAAAQAAGYVGATTVNPGWAGPHEDRYRLPRLVVLASTSPSQLLAQIAAAQTSTSDPSTYTGPGLA